MSSDVVAVIGFVVAVRADAAARAGRHGHGPRRRRRLRLPDGQRAGAQDRRPHLDAHGDRLEFRGHPAVPADGLVRHHLGHEPRAVPRRQRLSRSPARRARHRHHRRLRRVRGDLRLLGGDRRHLLARRLSGDAPLRLSAVLRHRRDRRRRHARHHDPALDRAGGLRPDHRAGHRQAVHCRHRAGHPGRRHVHAHHHHHRLAAAGLPAGRSAQLLARAARRPARRVGDAAAVRVRHRRHLWRHVHRHRSGRHGRGRRLPHRHRAAAPVRRRHPRARCWKPRAPRRPCSPC